MNRITKVSATIDIEGDGNLTLQLRLNGVGERDPGGLSTLGAYVHKLIDLELGKVLRHSAEPDATIVALRKALAIAESKAAPEPKPAAKPDRKPVSGQPKKF